MYSQQYISLRPYNTFGMDVPAASLTELHDPADLARGLIKGAPRVLGGGSNILLTGPVQEPVVLNRLKGITAEREDARHIWVRAMGGEQWHDLVLYGIGNGLGGLENLALIPGTVGAAPIQNIGAYGAEVRETIESVTAWHWERQELITLQNADCAFGYRDSIFKRSLRGKTLVTSVLFRLAKHPQLRTSYGAITEELERMGVAPSVQHIAQAVINIRRSKLPDPALIGNAGSFFKNPEIPRALYETLLQQHPLMPSYRVDDDTVKVPAGWLIEQCGWKGRRTGDAGVHARQALVLVNYGQASGADILNLSEDIIRSVQAKYDILLEREVQIW